MGGAWRPTLSWPRWSGWPPDLGLEHVGDEVSDAQERLRAVVRRELLDLKQVDGFVDERGKVRFRAVAGDLLQYWAWGLAVLTALRLLVVVRHLFLVVSSVAGRLGQTARGLVTALGLEDGAAGLGQRLGAAESLLPVRVMRRALRVALAGVTAALIAIKLDTVVSGVLAGVAAASSLHNFFGQGVLVLWALSWGLGYGGALGPFNGVNELVALGLPLVLLPAAALSSAELVGHPRKRKAFQWAMGAARATLAIGLPLLVAAAVRTATLPSREHIAREVRALYA